MSENESIRNACMKEAIVLWAKAYLSIVGLVGRRGGGEVRYAFLGEPC